ncbi:helix-turn-helix domain-containing protein [Phytohabitans flavus]|uniref:helix-turn-helix domain-containing protein n=1 Tax=Phytohabitans flavus TaxID=1076124 RepID=UPI003626A59E
MPAGRGYGRPGPRGIAIDVPLSQAEIASLVGGAEASVHRVFTDLRQRGLLSVGYRRLVVHDLEALQAMALEEEK